MSVPRSFGFGSTVGFPKKLHVRHRYTVQNSISSGAPQQFSCNGMYDPGLSLFGGQPLYFDQVAAIYNHYTVFASRCHIEFLNEDQLAVPIALYIAPSTTPATSYLQAREQPGAIQKVCPGVGGAGHVALTLTWNAKDYFGGDVYDNDDLQGSASANPVEQSYFTVFVANLGAGVIAGRVQVTIEYDAVWDELRTIALS